MTKPAASKQRDETALCDFQFGNLYSFAGLVDFSSRNSGNPQLQGEIIPGKPNKSDQYLANCFNVRRRDAKRGAIATKNKWKFDAFQCLDRQGNAGCASQVDFLVVALLDCLG